MKTSELENLDKHLHEAIVKQLGDINIKKTNKSTSGKKVAQLSSNTVKNEPTSDELDICRHCHIFVEQGVCCDKCCGWYHYGCEGIEASELTEDSEYFCLSCKSLNDDLCPLTDGLLRDDEIDSAHIDLNTHVPRDTQSNQCNTLAVRVRDSLAQSVHPISPSAPRRPVVAKETPAISYTPISAATSTPRERLQQVPPSGTSTATTPLQTTTREHVRSTQCPPNSTSVNTRLQTPNPDHVQQAPSPQSSTTVTTQQQTAVREHAQQPQSPARQSTTLPKQRQRKKPVQQSDESEQLNLAKSLVNNLERKLSDTENTNRVLKAELNSMKCSDTFNRNEHISVQPHSPHVLTSGQPTWSSMQSNLNMQAETELAQLRYRVQNLEMDSLRQRLTSIERTMLQNQLHTQTPPPPRYYGSPAGPFPVHPLPVPPYMGAVPLPSTYLGAVPLPPQYMGTIPPPPPPHMYHNNQVGQFNRHGQPTMSTVPHMYRAPMQTFPYAARYQQVNVHPNIQINPAVNPNERLQHHPIIMNPTQTEVKLIHTNTASTTNEVPALQPPVCSTTTKASSSFLKGPAPTELQSETQVVVISDDESTSDVSENEGERSLNTPPINHHPVSDSDESPSQPSRCSPEHAVSNHESVADVVDESSRTQSFLENGRASQKTAREMSDI
ncbi:MAG: PHD finger domain-containing protein [Sedimenticola sp.]